MRLRLARDAHGGAVGGDLRRPLHDGGGGVADADDRVRPHGLRVVHHALGGDLPGLGEHLGVALDFAAHQGLEPLGNIPADVFGLNGAALDQAQHFQLLAGNVISID